MNETDRNIMRLAEIIRQVDDSLTFTVMEIGAVPVEGKPEPFHQLLDLFPGSTNISFEVDESVCVELNKKARPGMSYHSVALGITEEVRPFYETNHPMCSSLYKPNEELLALYNNLDVAMLKSTDTIETVSLDHFASANNIASVDFVKIDIQGAELDVFRGGVAALKDTVAIVTEVEFIPLYVDQPLFGDVCHFLAGQELMFHKFLGMAGRTLKPMVMGKNPNFASQHMWTDALFIRDVNSIPNLAAKKLLKLGVLASIYGSIDVAFQCFRYYDEQNGTNIHQSIFS